MLLLQCNKDDRGYNNGLFYYPGEAKALGIGAIDVHVVYAKGIGAIGVIRTNFLPVKS